MRRLELLVALVAVFAIGWPVVFGVRPRRGIVAGTAIVAVLAQLRFEGGRWQMLPLYVVAVGLAVGDLLYLDRRIDWSRRIIRGVLGTIGLLVVLSLPTLFPVPALPAPAGPDAIGTITVDLTDRERVDPYGGGPRRLSVQVWYPAAAEPNGERVVWNRNWDVVAPAMSRNMGLPSWFLGHTRYTLSHATEAPTLAPGSFPVIVFSHGWQGVGSVTLHQVEHLVSNGYIVVAPDHTDIAAATVLEDGSTVYADPDVLPEPEDADAAVRAAAATQMVDTMSADLVSVLNALEAGGDGPFAAISDGADLNRIGLYGHTEGGGAVVKTCLEDDRCGAVFAMDPWVEPLAESDLQLTMTKPALYMRSDDWADTPNDALLRGIAARGANVTYWLGVDATTENDFTLMPLLTPLASRLGLRGDIPAGRVVPIVDNYLLGFFDVYLLGTGSAALDSVTFPEVSVSVIVP